MGSDSNPLAIEKPPGLTGEGSDSNLPARGTIRAGSVSSSHGRAQNHNDNLIIPPPLAPPQLPHIINLINLCFDSAAVPMVHLNIKYEYEI